MKTPTARTRRTILTATATVALPLAGFFSRPATAGAFPDKPLRFIVPFAAGGGVDNVARAINQAMSQRLGQPIIVENRPGASANIGADLVAKSAPDGYTLLIGATFLAFNRATMKSLAYDALRDLVPVGRIVRAPFVMVVGSDTPFRTVADVVDWMKRHPKDSTYGAVGAGTPTLLMFAQNTGTHAVQVLYKGGAAAMPDLMAGRLTYMIQPAGEVLPHIAGGRLRALAVTGSIRSPYLADVPTFAEAGVANLSLTGWWGMFAPAGTPAPVIERLSQALAAVLDQDDVRATFERYGLEVAAQDHQAFGAFYRSEIAAYAATAERYNLKVE